MPLPPHMLLQQGAASNANGSQEEGNSERNTPGIRGDLDDFSSDESESTDNSDKTEDDEFDDEDLDKAFGEEDNDLDAGPEENSSRSANGNALPSNEESNDDFDDDDIDNAFDDDDGSDTSTDTSSEKEKEASGLEEKVDDFDENDFDDLDDENGDVGKENEQIANVVDADANAKPSITAAAESVEDFGDDDFSDDDFEDIETVEVQQPAHDTIEPSPREEMELEDEGLGPTGTVTAPQEQDFDTMEDEDIPVTSENTTSEFPSSETTVENIRQESDAALVVPREEPAQLSIKESLQNVLNGDDSSSKFPTSLFDQLNQLVSSGPETEAMQDETNELHDTTTTDEDITVDSTAPTAFSIMSEHKIVPQVDGSEIANVVQIPHSGPLDSAESESSKVNAEPTQVKTESTANDPSKQNGSSSSHAQNESFYPTTLHTIINISVDVNHHLLAGYVDLFLKNTTSADIHELQLNVSDQMKIEGVFEVKSFEKEAEVLSANNFSDVVQNKLTTRESMAYANSESSESSEYERSLAWAMDIRKKQIIMSNAGLLAINFLESWKKGSYLRLRIYYQIVRPVSGLYFVDDVEDEESRVNSFTGETVKKKVNGLCYTCNFSGGARSWFPCLDSLETFSSYEIEITTHKDAIVVCTGNLVEQTDNNEMNLRTTKFIHDDYPIPPYTVGFAIGPFKVYIDEDLPHITHFYPQKYPISHIKHTVLYLRQVLDYYTTLTGVPVTDLCPYYNIVFLDAPFAPMFPMYSLGIVSTEYILDPAVIDGLIRRRVEFCSIVASQYFGGLLLPKFFNDFWIVVGLSRYMGLLFLEHAYGMNELIWYLMEKCEEMPKIDNATISLSSTVIFPQVLHNVIQEKSPLIFYMLGQIIGKMNMDSCIMNFVTKAKIDIEKIQNRVVVPETAVDRMGNKVDSFFLAMEEAIMETKAKRVISTKQLRSIMTTVYRIPKQDVRDFFGYWVQGRGFPQFQCAYTYDPNRSKILIALRQLFSVDSEATVYVGKIRFSIHEKEFLYSREIKVDVPYFWTELDCSSKPRKNQKKATNANEVNYEIPIHYIIANSGMQVMCQINMWQDVAQWVYQVEGAKDIVGLYSAVRGLKYWQSQTMFGILKGMLHSTDCYFRIRYAIVDMFSEATCPELADQVFSMLREAFTQKFCDKTTGDLIPNDFSNVVDYYLKRKIISAFGYIRRENGYTPEFAVELIRSLLQNNDNSRNKYSDTHYIATLLEAITNAKPQKQDLNEVVRWNKKYLVLDSLIPSHNSHYSIVTLKNLTELFCSNRLALDLTLFEERLRPDVPILVRETALQCLTRIHDKAFPNLTEPLNFRKVFNQIIDQILDGDDPPVNKHRLCRVLVDGINKCSARIMENNLRAKMAPETSMEKFLKTVRSPSKKNRHLVERLWKHALDHGDLRMQSDIADLYLCLWGINSPSCYCRKPEEFVHTVRIDKYDAILYDPDYPVIQYREPDKATTSETSVGFKVTRMTIIEGENAPPFIGSHSRQVALPQTGVTQPTHPLSDLPTPNVDLVKHSDFGEEGKKRKRSMGPPKRKKRRKDVEASDYIPENAIVQEEVAPLVTPDEAPPVEESVLISDPYLMEDDVSARSFEEPMHDFVTIPNSIEGVTLQSIAFRTPLNLSPHERSQVLSSTDKILQIAQSNKAISLLQVRPITNFNFYCELIVDDGSSPQIFPIRLLDSVTSSYIYRTLPFSAPVLSDIDGLIYTHTEPVQAPVSDNAIYTTVCQVGDVVYWPDGQSITFPYGKTPITTPALSHQKLIQLYGECEVVASTIGRLPPLKKSLQIQLRRGNSFSAKFLHATTREELCTVHGVLNHTVHAVDFFRKMTPFLSGDTVAWNEMLGFPLLETDYLPNGKVIQNHKSFVRNQIERTEIALWTQPDETKTKFFHTLILGTGPGVIPEKSGKFPLITKCPIIGKFLPSQGFEKLMNLIKSQTPLSVIFRRNYIFIKVNGIHLEFNTYESLTTDFIFASLPFEGVCQLVCGFIVMRCSGLSQDRLSVQHVTEAKAGTLVYWTEKSILMLCLRNTVLPGACCEIATVIEDYIPTLEQIGRLDANTKLKVEIAAAELGVNV